MGDTGPCGPCSEIFLIMEKNFGGFRTKNQDGDRYVEIWNSFHGISKINLV